MVGKSESFGNRIAETTRKKFVAIFQHFSKCVHIFVLRDASFIYTLVAISFRSFTFTWRITIQSAREVPFRTSESSSTTTSQFTSKYIHMH